MDEPSKHQGRKRTIAHVDGQFAAYVYAPIFPVQRLQQVVQEIFGSIDKHVQNVHRLVHFKSDALADENGIPPIPPSTINGVPHLSLTRPIYLRAHQRGILKQAVREVTKKVPKCVYGSVQRRHSGHNAEWLRFKASFASFVVLDNDNKTRSFLALEIGAGHDLVSPMDSGFQHLTVTVQGDVRVTQTNPCEPSTSRLL